MSTVAAVSGELWLQCFIPRTLITHDTYVPYLYSDEDIQKIFEVADSLVVTRGNQKQIRGKRNALIPASALLLWFTRWRNREY